ncbi:MurR/RpiR family transcriptional regulator [Mesoplasma photuris]|uniref:MurR/RpiR family transcriptional regulator n=1 Tax=Mesoplasma photuris TaxID=217731 RepID=UPI0004E125B4|nr:MurR/RpiR family transcriptional regulator [Mesoplasma photuris]
MVLEKIFDLTKEDGVNKEISDTILKEIMKNRNYSISVSELAELANLSQPTITRFVQNNFNLKSYKNFTKQLNEEVLTYFEHKNEINDIKNNSDLLIKDVIKTLDEIDSEVLVKAAKMIAGAEKINVTGIAGNSAMKLDIEHKLAQVGKIVMSGRDWHQEMMNLNSMNEKDLLIIISYSGDKYEMNRIAEKAKTRGIKIISFTGNFDSNLRDKSDVVLLANSSDPKYRTYTTTARVCMMALWQILFREMIKYIKIDIDAIEEWKWTML